MTLKEYLQASKEGDEAIAKLLSDMSSFQERTATRVSGILADLDISGGRLVASEANMARLSEVVNLIERDFADPKWEAAVTDYLKSFDAIGASTVGYVTEFGAVDQALLTSLRQQYKQISAEYLLNPASFNRTMITPISQEVGSYIATGSKFSELVEATNRIITGGEVSDGAILGSARTTATDLVSIYQRTATKVAGDSVGAQFFYYNGPIIDTTRPFCEARAGRYWHRKEIESWANLKPWDGQIPGTNSETVFTLLGGYGCEHILVPVARRDVPASDLERMRKAGFIE